jgi:dimethylamine monooxygenase subunit A
MRFRRGDVAEFFRNRENPTLLAERRKWLAENPERYAASLPEAQPIVAEVAQLARSVGIQSLSNIVELGGAWEPDLLVLGGEPNAQPRLVAGCVCFPSSWSLEEKIGHPLDVIHKPVATLNEQFASPIQQFMARMKPHTSWERINWGLSRSPDLNQHPARKLPRLDADVSLEEVFFRAEYQSLVSLPQSNGVLFGIRLVIEPMTSLRERPDFTEGLTRALRTMPEPIAQYKGFATARERIISLLAS